MGQRADGRRRRLVVGEVAGAEEDGQLHRERRQRRHGGEGLRVRGRLQPHRAEFDLSQCADALRPGDLRLHQDEGERYRGRPLGTRVDCRQHRGLRRLSSRERAAGRDGRLRREPQLLRRGALLRSRDLAGGAVRREPRDAPPLRPGPLDRPAVHPARRRTHRRPARKGHGGAGPGDDGRLDEPQLRALRRRARPPGAQLRGRQGADDRRRPQGLRRRGEIRRPALRRRLRPVRVPVRPRSRQGEGAAGGGRLSRRFRGGASLLGAVVVAGAVLHPARLPARGGGRHGEADPHHRLRHELTLGARRPRHAVLRLRVRSHRARPRLHAVPARPLRGRLQPGRLSQPRARPDHRGGDRDARPRPPPRARRRGAEDLGRRGTVGHGRLSEDVRGDGAGHRGLGSSTRTITSAGPT